MSTVGKVILGVGAAFVLIVIIVVVAGAVWWSKSGKEMFKGAVESAEKSDKEGRDFGRTAQNEACVDEALTRNKKNSSFGAAISTQLFLQGCLKASQETPGFCTGVPKPTQIIEGPKWQIQKCRERAPNDEFCPQVFQKVEEYCYNK